MEHQEERHLEWIAAHLSGNATPDQEQALNAWLETDPENQSFFHDMQSLWEASATEPLPRAVDSGKAWAEVEARLDRLDQNHQAGGGSTKVSWLRRAWIAASILLVVGMGGWWYSNSEWNTPEPVVMQTQSSELREIQLPDGSKVWLNQYSSLEYDDRFQPRTVVLEGEAYFEVESDLNQPFTVRTGAVSTRVLGTSFNVRAYPEEQEVRVDVTSGQVEVALEATQKEQLSKGEAATVVLESLSLKKEAMASANATAWRDQTLVFQNVPLSEAVEDLERLYRVKIELGSAEIGNCRIKMDRMEGKELEMILLFITEVNGLTYTERDQGGWIITGPGCD